MERRAKQASRTEASEPLERRIVHVAARIFAAEGQEGLSMRRIAQEAGCSQMAMYRHFANKEALMQHLCSVLYEEFAAFLNIELRKELDASKKLRRLIHAVLTFAEQNPEHYSLVLLVRHTDPKVTSTREKLGSEFQIGVSEIVRAAMAKGTSKQRVEETLRRMMECLHGTVALWLAHPRVYGLTPKIAASDIESTWTLLLDQQV